MASRSRWRVIGIFFAFMLLHQTDKLLIGPLTTPIMADFKIDEAAMGLVGTGALVVGAILYPLWGYLYDRYTRSKLIALASAIWGLTTWFGAVAPNYCLFLVARASTGIDDSSYPGIYSLISDYFGPETRSRIYGLLQLAQPFGYMLGLVLALTLGGAIGWRNVYLLTGAVGIVLAVVIYRWVREIPRGKAEPELRDLAEIGIYRFDRHIALGLLRKKALVPLFLQGFFGVFPWTVISFWIFRYLEVERGYSSDEVLLTTGLAILAISAGYMVGGALGDWLFGRIPRGRLIVCTSGVITGAILLLITVNIPLSTTPGIGVDMQQADAGATILSPWPDRPAAKAGIQPGDELLALDGVDLSPDTSLEKIQAQLQSVPNNTVELTIRRGSGEITVVSVKTVMIGHISPLFVFFLCLTAFFIPFSGPNIISTVYDITVPEVRSTALAVQYFVESGGAAFAPAIAGFVAVRTSLGTAILLICFSTWVIAALFLVVATYFVPKDIADLRDIMRQRADEARQNLESAG